MKTLIALIAVATILTGCASSKTLLTSSVTGITPKGYVKLCREHPELESCQLKVSTRTLTPSFNLLKSVNLEVNSIPYVTQSSEDWFPKPQGSDCGSFAINKMELLLKKGWPVDKLRLATVFLDRENFYKTDNEGYHLVLLAELDGQTYVLDNINIFPMEFNMIYYKYWLVQVPGTPEWKFYTKPV